MGHVTGTPTWTILVPTLGERRPLFERLMGVLLPQVDAAAGRVRVLAYWNNGRPSLPEIRHRLVAAVETEYVSHVDDDDLVSPDFVPEILGALESRPDYVGFQVQCYTDGLPTAIAHHDLVYGRWYNRDSAYFRDITHLNPLRTDLARLADFRKARPGQPEDRAWVGQLRRSGRVRSQVVVPRILYHYLYSTSRSAGIGSRWKAPSLIQPGTEPARFTSPFFSYYPGCLDA